MLGLKKIPTEKDLSVAYGNLFSNAVTLENIGLYSQWVRFDPRLGEILIGWFEKNWKEIFPLRLNEVLLKQPWPQCLGVLFEQIAAFSFKDKAEVRLFRKWASLVLANVLKKNHELFFIGTMAFASKRVFKEAENSHKSYLKWGFLGTDLFFNKSQKHLIEKSSKTLLSKEKRFFLLKKLFSEKKRITIQDYREYLGWAVSQRQAQMDVKKFMKIFPKIKKYGNTKGCWYSLRNTAK